MYEIVLDFERWTVKDYQDFQKSTTTNDIELQIQLMVKAITRWEFDVEVSYENILDMPYDVISALVGLLGDTFKEIMEEPIQGFRVDLKKAKVSDFISYQKAIQSFDVPVMLGLFKKVIKSVPGNSGYLTPTQLQELPEEEILQMPLEKWFAYVRAVGKAFGEGSNSKN